MILQSQVALRKKKTDGLLRMSCTVMPALCVVGKAKILWIQVYHLHIYCNLIYHKEFELGGQYVF